MLQTAQNNKDICYCKSKNEWGLSDNSYTSIYSDFQSSKSALPKWGGKRTAFTLAEVLITLGIIGVVAALTLPTLIQNYQEKVIINKLKKMYSLLSQAHNMYKIENDENKMFDWSPEGAVVVANIFKPYLKVSKDCGLTGEECIGTESYKRWDKPEVQLTNYATSGKYYSIILADGSVLVFRGGSSADMSHAEIFFDINGKNPPNVWGKDMFSFYISNRSNKIMPAPSELYRQSCIVEGDSVLWDCTAWVLINDNMDYLHCPEKLSWDGKTSCK